MQSTSLAVSFCGVMLRASVPGAQPAWPVDPGPRLRIAATAPTGDPVIGTITWATRSADGAIAVADGGDGKVRIFDAAGAPRNTIGRDGRGPGEFASLGWISRCGGDSLFVWDFVLARVSVLHPRDGYARVWSVADAQASGEPACSSRGELAFAARFRRTAESRPVETRVLSNGGNFRIWLDTFDVQTFDPAGKALRSLPRGVRRNQIVGQIPDGRRSGYFRPLGISTAYAFAGEDLVVAQNDSGQVQVVGTDGTPRGGFRLGHVDHEVGPAEYEAAVKNILLQVPPFFRDQFGAFARMVPRPERRPAFQSLWSDPAGLLWFETSMPGAERTVLRGFRTNGEAVATITLPAPVTVFEIGDDYVLGRVEDDDGDQQLVMYGFRRDARR